MSTSKKFSLATLLRLREIAVDREERLIGQIEQQIGQTTQTMNELETARQREIKTRETSLQDTQCAGEVMSSYAQVSAFESMKKAGEEQLAKLRTLRLQQLKAYEAAYRNREALAGLKEHQHQQYVREQTRREQDMMDDNFSSRRSAR